MPILTQKWCGLAFEPGTVTAEKHSSFSSDSLQELGENMETNMQMYYLALGNQNGIA